MYNCNNLVDFNICVKNEYFNKYVELVNNPTPIHDGQLFENHHVLPRLFYELVNLPCNDCSENLVRLNIQEHVLAHYYLSLCANSPKFKFGNITCLSLICHRDYSDITEEWICSNLTLLEDIRKEQRLLNSFLQKGLHAGDRNPRCKVTSSISAQVKELILAGKSFSEIEQLTRVGMNFIKSIADGTHWTCKQDGFFYDYRAVQRAEKAEAKAAELQAWIDVKHTCEWCGKVMVEKYAKGKYCSSHCTYSASAAKRPPEYYKDAVANRRSYKGENNPNYGKTASTETRDLISARIKEANPQSSRFRGKKHTEKSRIQIGASSRGTHWYTDGVISIRAKSCPEGFRPGCAPRTKKERINVQ